MFLLALSRHLIVLLGYLLYASCPIFTFSITYIPIGVYSFSVMLLFFILFLICVVSGEVIEFARFLLGLFLLVSWTFQKYEITYGLVFLIFLAWIVDISWISLWDTRWSNIFLSIVYLRREIRFLKTFLLIKPNFSINV